MNPNAMPFDEQRDRAYLDWCDSAPFSTCVRSRYMAVIVGADGRVIGTGYNGPPSHHPHCGRPGGCPREMAASLGEPTDPGYFDCTAVHAEANALLYSDRTQRNRAVLYVNGLPCWNCAKLIANSGVTRLACYHEPDREDRQFERTRELLERCWVDVSVYERRE